MKIQPKEKEKELKGLKETKNNGYDNKDGDLICNVGDHISYRFEVKKTLGKGSFGSVFRCFDHKTGEMIALKVLRNEKRLSK